MWSERAEGALPLAAPPPVKPKRHFSSSRGMQTQRVLAGGFFNILGFFKSSALTVVSEESAVLKSQFCLIPQLCGLIVT